MRTASFKTVSSITQLFSEINLKKKSIIVLPSKKDKSSEKGQQLVFGHYLY